MLHCPWNHAPPPAPVSAPPRGRGQGEGVAVRSLVELRKVNCGISDPLIDLNTVSRVLSDVEPVGGVDPHRDGAPETLLCLEIRRTLAFGGHIRTRLDELPAPF